MKRIGNIPLIAYPTVIWTRLTWCRRRGHNEGLDGEFAVYAPSGDETSGSARRFCQNCGAPWFGGTPSRLR
jgi:hypothetical protein